MNALTIATFVMLAVFVILVLGPLDKLSKESNRVTGKSVEGSFRAAAAKSIAGEQIAVVKNVPLANAVRKVPAVAVAPEGVFLFETSPVVEGTISGELARSKWNVSSGSGKSVHEEEFASPLKAGEEDAKFLADALGIDPRHVNLFVVFSKNCKIDVPNTAYGLQVICRQDQLQAFIQNKLAGNEKALASEDIQAATSKLNELVAAAEDASKN